MINLNEPVKDKQFIQAGEKCPVVFKKAEVTEEGRLKLYFVNEEDEWFEPQLFDVEDKEDWQKEQLNGQLSKLIFAFYTKDELIAAGGFGASTYKGLFQRAVELLKDKSDTECTVKIVVNKKGFTTIPNKFDWISTEKNPVKLKTNPKYDKYVFVEESPTDTLNSSKDDNPFA